MTAFDTVRAALVSYLATCEAPSRSHFIEVCRGTEGLAPHFVEECLNALAAVYPNVVKALA